MYGDHGLTLINFPGALSTYAYSINNYNQVVGVSVDAYGIGHSYLYSQGVFTPIDVPAGSSYINLYGINDAGQIVGNSSARGAVLATATPEPATYLLFFLGISCLVFITSWRQIVKTKC